MVGLLDIVPKTTLVKVGEAELEVRGLGIGEIASLLQRFPELIGVMEGRGVAGGVDGLARIAPHAIAAIIAAACGLMHDEAAEDKAARLGIEVQFDILKATFDATFPGGAGPFVEKLQAIIRDRDQFDMSRYTRGQATDMPPQLSGLSPSDTPK